MGFNQISRDFIIRLASESDCKMVWELANDPVVRGVSFSSDVIPWDNHVQWFKAKLLDADHLFYIVEDVDLSFIGQVRYQIEDKQAVVSIALTSAYRGKGYAGPILCNASQKVFEDTTVEMIRAYIKPGNASSLRSFAKANFTDNGLVDVRGNQAFEFILCR